MKGKRRSGQSIGVASRKVRVRADVSGLGQPPIIERPKRMGQSPHALNADEDILNDYGDRSLEQRGIKDQR